MVMLNGVDVHPLPVSEVRTPVYFNADGNPIEGYETLVSYRPTDPEIGELVQIPGSSLLIHITIPGVDGAEPTVGDEYPRIDKAEFDELTAALPPAIGDREPTEISVAFSKDYRDAYSAVLEGSATDAQREFIALPGIELARRTGVKAEVDVSRTDG